MKQAQQVEKKQIKQIKTHNNKYKDLRKLEKRKPEAEMLTCFSSSTSEKFQIGEIGCSDIWSKGQEFSKSISKSIANSCSSNVFDFEGKSWLSSSDSGIS